MSTITFDDIQLSAFPKGYGGLNWQNFSLLDPTSQPASGYQNGRTPGSVVAYIEVGTSDLPEPLPGYLVSPDASPFTLNDLSLNAAWNNGVTVLVEGYRSGELQYSKTVTADTNPPQSYVFDFANVDAVKIVSSGGTPTGDVGQGAYLAFDSVTINEPV